MAIVNAMDDTHFAAAVQAMSSKQQVVAGITNDMSLRRMERAVATLTSANQLIAELAGSWATPEGGELVQLLVATHSPLVLASVEPEFDPEQDAIFNIQLQDGQATITAQPWAAQGDVVNWLVSSALG